ncbi:MAG: type II 3-dehydroquinate dehydratase [Deltaproteobacteria bacterium]|nr:type II 3-dehydroquinate dehydratase [Deltaproteobacteria bacterium]
MKKILVINGPNLNLLGQREPGLYGHLTLAGINDRLKKLAETLNLEIFFIQSNHEGALVDAVQLVGSQYDGGILNAAAYTHTSLALRDAVLAIDKPVIEVHLTNPASREEFRQRSLLAGAASGLVAGFGARSYELALYWFAEES